MHQVVSLTERAKLGTVLNDLGLLGIGIEVGVFRGEFARILLESWRGRELLLIDPWRHLSDYYDSWNRPDEEMEANYLVVLEIAREFGSRARVIRERSEVAAQWVTDESCDFVYIDANHAYDSVRKDLRVWFPKLRRGGLMCGHDYFDALADETLEPVLDSRSLPLLKEELTSYGVKSAVDEFARTLGAAVGVTSEEYPTWFFLK